MDEQGEKLRDVMLTEVVYGQGVAEATSKGSTSKGKKKPLVEFDMLRIIWRHFTKPAKFMFSNIFYFYDGMSVELDFLMIDKQGYCNEYEIKCDKRDFAEEFKAKPKKHELLAQRDKSCPNRYFFAAPQGVIDKDLVPEYAGFVEFIPNEDGTHRMRTVKAAPLLHREILDERNLFQKIYYSYFNFKQILYSNDRKRIRRADGTEAVKKSVTKRKSRAKGFLGKRR